MNPLVKAISGAFLVLVGIIRLLADKDLSIMDQVINIICVIGILIGVMAITSGLNAENKQ